MGRLYLGIDLGTSSVKTVLIDEKRQVVAQSSEEYEVGKPKDGWSEVNQECWFDSTVRAIHSVLKGQDVSALRSIGVTGQMHTLVVLGKDGAFIRPALMWNDLRTKELIPGLKEKMSGFTEGDYLSRIVSTGSPCANLYWMKKNEPENFEKIEKFLIGPDYIVYRLTGTYGTDYCEASTSSMYELKNARWSEEVRTFLGLRQDVYPLARGSAQVVGTVTKEIAALFGIPENVKVLTGTGDNSATAISTGCLGKRYPVISLGTSGVLIIPVAPEEQVNYGKKILFSFEGQPDHALVQGVVQSNGNTLEWLICHVLGCADFSVIDEQVDLKKEKDNQILFYPHLMGDKTLYADPSLRGAMIGLSVDSSHEKLIYAVLEGICFGFRELAEHMNLSLKKTDSIKIVGGGTGSRVWMQIMANVLNCPIEVMDGMVGAGFGIALLAVQQDTGNGQYDSAADATIHTKEMYFPDPEMAERCDRKYQMYKRMYDGLKYIMEGKPLKQ